MRSAGGVQGLGSGQEETTRLMESKLLHASPFEGTKTLMPESSLALETHTARFEPRLSAEMMRPQSQATRPRWVPAKEYGARDAPLRSLFVNLAGGAWVDNS